MIAKTAGGPVEALVGFTEVLRHAGLNVDADKVATFVAGSQLLDPTDMRSVYHAGRVALCTDPEDYPLYDLAFATWFDPDIVARTPSNLNSAEVAPHTGLDSGADGNDGRSQAVNEVFLAASAREVLRNRDFQHVGAAERSRLYRMLGQLRVRPPLRVSRRLASGKAGHPDWRLILRDAGRHDGEVTRLRWRKRVARPRRVVVLVDVSGSMKMYSEVLLRCWHSYLQANTGDTEVFALATRLTRLSGAFANRDPDVAMRSAHKLIVDRDGGTRLGEMLEQFVNEWGRRGMARQAVVVVCSDGWERGDATQLGEQIHKLSLLAHRVFWLSPHAGKDGYQPIQSGIAAVLPHLDKLVAGHSLLALEQLVKEIADA
ncbi:vWA domain-containing protein [Gordonia sp. C13]|uniref:vWA domain-containing protein n=1 Tax=Gordonia sp. C13 TaxID=2935078 RepID=UPI00200A6F2D|nr:VWA domain-containing protein [Gordonia sp. C13]MCK8615327.1 VWA domain-containing protein [Gordonia sp. C13]